MKFFVINGPNLNMLGIREPAIYGSTTYADLVRLVEQAAKELQVEVEILQSNHEGTLVDEIQRAYYEADGIVTCLVRERLRRVPRGSAGGVRDAAAEGEHV